MARTDELIKKDIIDQLVRDNRVDASKITIEVNKGDVTLSGEVPTYFARSAAYEDVRNLMGVMDVKNELKVSYPSAISMPPDIEIRTSIGNRLSANPDIDLRDMEVVVDAGHVTLKGTVDAYWKKIHAEELVAAEPGVVLIENLLAVVPTGDFLDRAIADDIVDSLECNEYVSVGADVSFAGGTYGAHPKLGNGDFGGPKSPWASDQLTNIRDFCSRSLTSLGLSKVIRSALTFTSSIRT
jgi:osmotically-inducible protein OsmY